MSETLIVGDSREQLKTLPDHSIDAIVTDPPYELSFMGKKWDGSGIAYSVPLWTECFRVLKPGGHLLAFGGTRTHHRMTCAIEDAGFEIRDEIDWVYGSGFPKSLDVSKAIDKAAGAEREIIGRRTGRAATPLSDIRGGDYNAAHGKPPIDLSAISAPATDAAKQWQGWGTALKPGREPIILARKPLIGTVAETVQQHGTGALDIDICRIATGGGSPAAKRREASGKDAAASNAEGRIGRRGSADVYMEERPPEQLGRWPANFILTHSDACEEGDCAPDCPVRQLDEQSLAGGMHSAGSRRTEGSQHQTNEDGGLFAMGNHPGNGVRVGDTGGASRFFYVPKTSRKERNAGCEDLPNGNNHPTVKPLALMRYLVRLITPPGGVVLDPFTGSGSTGCAAVLEGFSFIGIELEQAHVDIAAARIAHWTGEKEK